MPELYMLILAGPIILFSLVIHEFAHGFVSVKLGDPTPKWQGRLTLNPLAHLDPFGTLMLVLTMIKGFGFGWAKPVQINPTYYKNPMKGSMLVALAGPLSNLVMAFVFGLPLRLLNMGLWRWPINADFFGLIFQFFYIGVMLNLSLAFFNLIPIPPLDGSRIVRYFLRGRAFEIYNSLERYGFLILFVCLFFFQDVFSRYLSIFVRYFIFIITGLS